MKITIESITGQEYHLTVDNRETIGGLKTRIWERIGIPSYHQGLIFGGLCISNDDGALLVDCGVHDNVKLKLVLITRSGPLATKAPKATVETFIDDDHSASASTYSEECAEPVLDMTFTEERQADARRRADENLRTMNKMRELRQNFERLKMNKKVVVDASPSTSSRNLHPLVVESKSSVGLSAPEDTSAKESSAGETEYEDYRDLQNYFFEKQQRLANLFEDEQKSTWRPLRHRYPVDYPPYVGRPNRIGCSFRVVSSSSDPESSGAVWTGSEIDDDVLYTADEGLPPETSKTTVVSDGYESDEQDEEYFSGEPIVDVNTAVTRRLPIDIPSDPSEWSSGMVICDLSYDMRRAKVRRRHHQPNPKRATDYQEIKLPNKRTVRPPSAVLKNRPRSKSRQTGLLVNGAGVASKQRPSSTGESSSDENMSPTKRGPSGPGTSVQAIRKTPLSAGRGQKYRVPDKYPMDAHVRMHKLPQSSQSQQRCNTCGLRLIMSATFQCRCGKTLCSRHRHPEAHTCTYDLNTKSEPKWRQVKIQDCSD